MSNSTSQLESWKQRLAPHVQEAIDLVLSSKYGNRGLDVFYRTSIGADHLTFITVPEHLRVPANNVSIIGIAIDIYIDDIVDKCRDQALFEHAYNFMVHRRRPPQALRPLERLFEIYYSTINRSPNFKHYEFMVWREWKGVLDAIAYSVAVNDVTQTVDFTYENAVHQLASNMHHAVKHTVDICYSPDWSDTLTPIARQLMHHAQIVTRIGNWLKSWKQEYLVDRDITSGVFALAIEWGVVTREALLTSDAPEKLIERIDAYQHPERGAINQHLLERIQHELDIIQAIPDVEQIIDRAAYIAALQNVVERQLAATNEKR
jgi:hypothetical protein